MEYVRHGVLQNPRGKHRQIPVHDAGGRGAEFCVKQIFSGTCKARNLTKI